MSNIAIYFCGIVLGFEGSGEIFVRWHAIRMFCIALKYVSSACHSMKINYLCCDKTIIKIKYISLIFLAIVSNALPSECDYIFIKNFGAPFNFLFCLT